MYSSQKLKLFSWKVTKFWKPSKSLPKQINFQVTERFFDFVRKNANPRKKVVRWFSEFSIIRQKWHFQLFLTMVVSHIGEFLSHEAPMWLILSEIGRTLRLEQNKIPWPILKMIINIKHPAKKTNKICFSPISKKPFL